MDNSLKKKIDSFFKGDDNRPMLVDVSTHEDLQEINQTFSALVRKDVSELVPFGLEIPAYGDIFHYMQSCSEQIVLLTGLGTFLKLVSDEDEFKSKIKTILSSSFKTKFLIVTYQCSNYLDTRDVRLRDKIIVCETNKPLDPSYIVLIPKNYEDYVKASNGISEALKLIETTSGKQIYTISNFTKATLKKGLARVEEIKSAYDLICLKDSSIRSVPSKVGSEDNWVRLLKENKQGSVENFIRKRIKDSDETTFIKNWTDYDEFEKWLFFLSLKLTKTKIENWVIDYSVGKSQTLEDFVKNIYLSLTEIDYKDPVFWDKYKTWKTILSYIKEDSIIYTYCSYVKGKNENALYYLTDNTDTERKTILEIIASYPGQMERKKLLDILSHVYKNLYFYLSDYRFEHEYLTNYFKDYKYLKIINKLTPEFKEEVDNLAAERVFNKNLMRRSEILADLNYTDSVIYFIDALGVEFLSFIERTCSDMDLASNIHVCRSNLPSITSENTEFKEFFKDKKIKVNDEKDLDNLIHNGSADYDFDKNKFPFYLTNEFEIIEKCLKNIKKKIKSQEIKKAVIVSDHGATRLAVLNTDMVRQDVESTGEHGGRICKIVPDMQNIPNAIIENGYCILADYNSFKGGRIGKFEMHGGATLEEVVIAVIEITEKNIKVNIRVESGPIKASYKTNAILKFFSDKKLSNVYIVVNSKRYEANSSKDCHYEVELDDIKKAGEYSFEVWSNGEIVSADNKFKIQKESATTTDLWG